MIRLKLFLILILLLASTLGYAQIDYKALVRNLEDVTKDTNLKEYFEGLSSSSMNKSEGEFKDERFLRLYGVIVDDVEFESSWSGRYINIRLFNEEVDYKVLKEKFTSHLGTPVINDRYEDELEYTWSTQEKQISMYINLKDGKFLEFKESLYIKFLEE